MIKDTVKSLKEECKQMGLKQYSKLNKQELIDYLDIEKMKIWEEQLPAAVYDLGGNLIIGDKIEEPLEIDCYLNIDI